MNQVRDTLYVPEGLDVDGQGVRVAVLDTGLDPDHPDLQRSLLGNESKSFALGKSIVDRVGHGTHVAGIIAGDGTASNGKFRGIAPGVELLIVRVLGANGRGDTDTVAAGVDYAMSQGADIINYSAGQGGRKVGPPPWKWPSELNIRDTAFREAAEAGVLCVAAAGNNGPERGTISRPGMLHGVLCVGSLTRDGDRVVETSSRGPCYIDKSLPVNAVSTVEMEDEPLTDLRKPDVVAPGGDAVEPRGETRRIAQMINASNGPASARSRHAETFLGCVGGAKGGKYYTRIGGTSQAAAAVSGLAALALQYGHNLGLDWGGNVGRMLFGILRSSAKRLRNHEVEDMGQGRLAWPIIRATVEDCCSSERTRQTVLQGAQLRLSSK